MRNVARNWFKAQWQSYVESLDADEAMAASTPALTGVVATTMIIIFAALAYVPALARLSRFKNAWGALCLTGIAAALTTIATKHKCRGTIGSLATLLDGACYSAALAFAAVNTKGGVSIALAVVQAIAIVAFPAQVYSLTILFGFVMTAPILLLLFVFQPSLPVTLILVAGVIMTLLFSLLTRNRRELIQRQRRLQSALGAAHQVADDSMQAALANTLLTLGHFLHELRNYQTAISANLSFVERIANLDARAAAALQDAQTAQHEQEDLVRSIIEDLQARAKPKSTSFPLRSVLSEFAAETRDMNVVVGDSNVDFWITGNPEHLRVVLLNLARNASQAGAQMLKLEARLDPSGQSVQLTAHDDGPGISPEKREELLTSFGWSSKADGSGLGLYLVRRYVELFGGNLRIEGGPLGGAAFVIRIPGNVTEKIPSSTSRTRGLKRDRAS